MLGFIFFIFIIAVVGRSIFFRPWFMWRRRPPMDGPFGPMGRGGFGGGFGGPMGHGPSGFGGPMGHGRGHGPGRF